MKTAALLAALALASCGLTAPPEWADTPNPLDTPATGIVEPEA